MPTADFASRSCRQRIGNLAIPIDDPEPVWLGTAASGFDGRNFSGYFGISSMSFRIKPKP
jgi:hypothetical protein